jgi:hypothetical protein
MTFKHGKFDDSAVLRSLEKIAIDKGLVKGSPTIKSAEHLMMGRDLTPGVNLSESIIKLCAGLRREGLHKHAEDIEKNYVHYKKAQTLYETSKETGEDLIDFAHPEGGHVLKDVEGKHKVMTVTERQEAIKRTLSKEPTGKLSVAEAIQAVKRIFAAEEIIKMNLNEYVASLKNEAIKFTKDAKARATVIADRGKTLLTGSSDHTRLQTAVSGVDSANPTVEALYTLKEEVMDAKEEARPSSLGFLSLYSGFSSEDWDKYKSEYDACVAIISSAIEKLNAIKAVELTGEVPDTAIKKVPLTADRAAEIRQKERQLKREERKTLRNEKKREREEAEEERKETAEDARLEKLENNDFSVATDKELYGYTVQGNPAAIEESKKRKIIKKKNALNNILTSNISRMNALKDEIDSFNKSPNIMGEDFIAKQSMRRGYFNGQMAKINSEIAKAKSELLKITSRVTDESTESEINDLIEEAKQINTNLAATITSIQSDFEASKANVLRHNQEIKNKKSGASTPK